MAVQAGEPAPLFFALSEQQAVDAVAACLESLGSIQPSATRHHDYVMQDSFDWRLYRAGFGLEQHRQGEKVIRSRMYNLHTHATLAEAPVAMPAAVLGFKSDSRSERLRELLVPLLKIRALIPVVRIRSDVQVLSLLNGDEKTVLRVNIEQHMAYPAGDDTGVAMGCYLRFMPVRGYDKYLNKARARLQKKLAVEAQAQDAVYDLALAAIGRCGMDYSSKLNVKLDPTMPAQQAARVILKHLFAIMVANEAGVVDDIDSEFLHDYRISVRRIRSALAQIKGVFPAKPLLHFREEFAWLGDITTPLRDLDVYLMDFDSYQQSLPRCMQPDLEPLRGYLSSQRNQVRRTLNRRLHSRRYQRLKQDWQTFLDDTWPEDDLPAGANKSILKVASRNIRRVASRVLREGEAITPDSPDEALHDLRKTCKKLRYLIEFFRGIYAASDVSRLVSDLKQLQDNLGLFQDLSVQHESLQAMCDDIQQSGHLPAATGRAIEVLIETMPARQQQSRQVFAKCFQRFAREKNRQRMLRLFGGRQK